MELADYLRVLRRSWRLLVSLTLLGTAAAAVTILLVTPQYTARTQLFVATQSSGTVTELQQGNNFTQARILSYVKTAETPAVLQEVADVIAPGTSVQTLSDKIDASADSNTVLITITAKDESPVQAAALAQATADSLIRVVQDLESTSADGTSPVRLSVITPAAAPSAPAEPNVGLYLLAGTLGGLVFGLLLALIRSSVDTKLRDGASVSRITSAPILGGIAYDDDAAKKPLLTQTGPQSQRAESYRQIRTNLQFANIANVSKTLLVTSSLPGEGKTTTATNMALAIAQAGQRVVLVDADLRRPMVAEYLGLERSVGLTTVLVGAADLQDVLQPWGDMDLFVMTSGQIPPNPSELLGSDAMAKLLERLEATFDVVIIDAPPLIPVTDASVLAQRTAGVVLVAGIGKIKDQDLERSLRSLELVEANLLGVVLNLLPTKGPDAYEYSYYTYNQEPDSGTGSRSRKPKGRLEKPRAGARKRVRAHGVSSRP